MSCRETDEILFYHEGGVDVGDVDSKAVRMSVEVDAPDVTEDDVITKLLGKVCALGLDICVIIMPGNV